MGDSVSAIVLETIQFRRVDSGHPALSNRIATVCRAYAV